MLWARSQIIRLRNFTEEREWLAPTLVLVAVMLLASWMGAANGGYFVSQWALVTFVLAVLALIASLAGVLRGTQSRWSTVALGLFAAYALWTLASLLWSSNRADAWLGAGQTVLYLLAFWLAVGLISLGASRRWVLAASVLGPTMIAALTLPALVPRIEELFYLNRLLGSVGYYNGEAAFLLVPFWVAVYLAGSRRINPSLRGLVLAGAALCIELAVLTQSRGAMVAMIVSLPIFFLVSGQRLRGFLALVPIFLALLVTFPGLNEVYVAFLNQEPAPAAIEEVLPTVWLTAAVVGLYGLLWGLIDRHWEPTRDVTRIVGGVVLVATVAAYIFGAAALSERGVNPIIWGAQWWEGFKNDDTTGVEQSRYLAASGSGRYTMWQVAGEDFVSHPLLGVGTYNYEPTYYQLRERDVGYIRQAHMLPLEVLSERGLVGGVLFFGFLITCLGAGLWKRFKHLSSEGKAQVGAMTAAIAYWFVHSSAEWFWQFPAVTLPVMVYLAMLVAPWQRVEAAPLRWPLRAVGAGVAVLAVVAVAPLYAADRYLAQSYALTDPSEALAAVERAQWFNPASPELSQREGWLAIQSGEGDRAEEAYRNAIQLNPDHYAQHALLGVFYEIRGDWPAALSSYKEALALNPLDQDLNRKVVQLEVRTMGD